MSFKILITCFGSASLILLMLLLDSSYGPDPVSYPDPLPAIPLEESLDYPTALEYAQLYASRLAGPSLSADSTAYETFTRNVTAARLLDPETATASIYPLLLEANLQLPLLLQQTRNPYLPPALALYNHSAYCLNVAISATSPVSSLDTASQP
jgi:hypothetical protein